VSTIAVDEWPDGESGFGSLVLLAVDPFAERIDSTNEGTYATDPPRGGAASPGGVSNDRTVPHLSTAPPRV
jgi:hypothetical protein